MLTNELLEVSSAHAIKLRHLMKDGAVACLPHALLQIDLEVKCRHTHVGPIHTSHVTSALAWTLCLAFAFAFALDFVTSTSTVSPSVLASLLPCSPAAVSAAAQAMAARTTGVTAPRSFADGCSGGSGSGIAASPALRAQRCKVRRHGSQHAAWQGVFGSPAVHKHVAVVLRLLLHTSCGLATS